MRQFYFAWVIAVILGALLIVVTAQQGVDAATVVLYASRAARVGTFAVLTDTTAAGGQALHQPNAGVPKIATPETAPSSRAELTFTADAGRAYHVWIRGRAEQNFWGNDSIFLQFNDSVTSTGAPVNRIGTTAAMVVSLEDGTGQGNSGWMWNDNGYGIIGADVYFAATGTHTLRLQPREDGIIIDQIILSPTMFFSQRPGSAQNDSTIYAASGTPGPTPTPSPTPTPTPPPPPPPVALCGTDPTAGSLRLAWDSAATATAYQVHFGSGAGQYGTTVPVGNVLTWTIPRRPDWYLVVTASNGNGTSGFSNAVTTATLP